jgi:hypothetical protein
MGIQRLGATSAERQSHNLGIGPSPQVDNPLTVRRDSAVRGRLFQPNDKRTWIVVINVLFVNPPYAVATRGKDDGSTIRCPSERQVPAFG